MRRVCVVKITFPTARHSTSTSVAALAQEGSIHAYPIVDVTATVTGTALVIVGWVKGGRAIIDRDDPERLSRVQGRASLAHFLLLWKMYQ